MVPVSQFKYSKTGIVLVVATLTTIRNFALFACIPSILLLLGDFLAIIFWQHCFKQLTHVSCFVSLLNIFSLVNILSMNRLTNEKRLQIIEFYYQNACSVKENHRALLPFYGQFNRPATGR